MKLWDRWRSRLARIGAAPRESTPNATPDQTPVILHFADTRRDEDSASDPWWRRKHPRLASAPPLLDHALHEAVRAVIRDPQLDLPRLPLVAQRALSLLSAAEFDRRELLRLLVLDPALAASVLRLANSAAYRGIREVTQLDSAVTRVGQAALRGLVLAESVRALALRVGDARSVSREVWRRQLACAAIAECAAPRIGLKPDDAFLIGLLHDVGDLALLRIVHDVQASRRATVSRAEFETLCADWHEHVGLRLADAWNLPDPLPELIGRHHAPIDDDDPLRRERTVIAFADAAAGMLDHGGQAPTDFARLECVQSVAAPPEADDAACPFLEELPAVVERRLEECERTLRPSPGG